MQWPDGPRSTSCRTRMGTSSSQMPVSSTTTAMDADAVEDIEVVTPHYRGAHAAAKVRAGFTRYRAVGARLGGLRTTGRSGRGVDPRLAEELLQ